MRIRLVLCLLSIAPIFFLSACSTPGCRAVQHAAAFGKLTHSDQKMVLHGRVRTSMNKDAVYIAWGKPDWRFEDGNGKRIAETWIYERQLTVYAPMNSYDQVYPAMNLYGPRYTPGIRPGFGYGGVSNTGFLSSPRAIVTDLRFKRADFMDNRLVQYEVRRGGRHLTVTQHGKSAPPPLGRHRLKGTKKARITA